MKQEITSIVINWEDQGLRMPGPDSFYRTTLNRKTNTLSIKHMRYGERYYWETVLPVSEEKMEQFFSLALKTDWEPDYSVMVCDGFRWDMRFKNGTRVVKKTQGTIDAPEETIELTKIIYSMIEDQLSTDFPQLWGYSPENEETDD